METKLLPIEVKADAEGVIEGYGSIFGNKDLGGDIVAKGAFSESLKSGRKPKMLFQHDPDRVLGVWDEVSEDEKGLRLKGRLARKTALGADVTELAQMGAIDGLSIGYRTTDDEITGGSRVIKAAELWEVSVVTFPMNTEARVDAVKAAEMTRREFEQRLTQDAKFSRSIARALLSGGLDAVKAMQDAGADRLDELRDLLSSRFQ